MSVRELLVLLYQGGAGAGECFTGVGFFGHIGAFHCTPFARHTQSRAGKGGDPVSGQLRFGE